MKKFSYQTRQQNLQKLQTEKFDLLIIGGGITGAGVARDAALRGLKVALVEAKDFASGTSSRSSKLVHGGIRYLENLDFKLVFEALSERTHLFKMAPHLVHPLRFMIPLYKSSRVGMFKMGLGMWLYDALALFQAPELHERLNANLSMQRMPIMNATGLEGSYVYSDAYMDDDRLVHETLRSANEVGATCVNYAEVLSAAYDKNTGHIQGLHVQECFSKQTFLIQAQHIISTVGPWTDLVGEKLVADWKKILRPTKGIHLTFHKDRLPLSCAVVMAAEKSNRIVFAIPRHEMVIVGTTDTDYSADPSAVKATSEDVQYLLHITNQYFPGAELKVTDILSSYVGVRPLVQDGSGSEGKTSREHTILHDDRGITFVAGGKYTTYRLMSEHIVDQCLKFFSVEKRAHLNQCQTKNALNSYTTVENYQQALQQADHDIEKLLAARYGLEYKVLLDNYGYTENLWQIEAYQAIHHTMCMNLTDFFTRRVHLMLAEKDHGLRFLEDIGAVFQVELNLSDAEIDRQKIDLKNYIKSELAWLSDFGCEYLNI